MTFKINGLFLGELEPSATIAGCIEVYENIWPEPYQTIEVLETLTNNKDTGIFWERAPTIGNGVFQDHRTNKMLSLSHLCDVTNNQILQNIHNQFYTTLLSTSNSYAKRFGINEPLFHEGYSVLKYSSGEEYRAHYDGGTGIGRSISALCYLNDDYEGGELEFPNFRVSIKPQAGMVILFPSNFAYTHIARPIVSGTKYALVTWIRDRQM